MQKNFIAVTPDSGSGDATVTVAAEENKLIESRLVPLTITANGISKSINIRQQGSVEVYAYIYDEAGDLTNEQIIVNGIDMINGRGEPAYINENRTINIETAPFQAGYSIYIGFEPDLQFLTAKSSSSDWTVTINTQGAPVSIAIQSKLDGVSNDTSVTAIINNGGSITINVVQNLSEK